MSSVQSTINTRSNLSPAAAPFCLSKQVQKNQEKLGSSLSITAIPFFSCPNGLTKPCSGEDETAPVDSFNQRGERLITIRSVFSLSGGVCLPARLSAALLPLAAVRHSFPLATGLHFIHQAQLVSVTQIRSFLPSTHDTGAIELGQANLCLPDDVSEYFVTEDSNPQFMRSVEEIHDELALSIPLLKKDIARSVNELKYIGGFFNEYLSKVMSDVETTTAKLTNVEKLAIYVKEFDEWRVKGSLVEYAVHEVENQTETALSSEYPSLSEFFTDSVSYMEQQLHSATQAQERSEKYIESEKEVSVGSVEKLETVEYGTNHKKATEKAGSSMSSPLAATDPDSEIGGSDPPIVSIRLKPKCVRRVE